MTEEKKEVDTLEGLVTINSEPAPEITLESISNALESVQNTYITNMANLISSIEGVKIVLDPMLESTSFEIHMGADLYEGVKKIIK